MEGCIDGNARRLGKCIFACGCNLRLGVTRLWPLACGVPWFAAHARRGLSADKIWLWACCAFERLFGAALGFDPRVHIEELPGKNDQLR